jgi:hypothetical protein
MKIGVVEYWSDGMLGYIGGIASLFAIDVRIFGPADFH